MYAADASAPNVTVVAAVTLACRARLPGGDGHGRVVLGRQTCILGGGRGVESCCHHVWGFCDQRGRGLDTGRYHRGYWEGCDVDVPIVDGSSGIWKDHAALVKERTRKNMARCWNLPGGKMIVVDTVVGLSSSEPPNSTSVVVMGG